jgi:tRNA pseudouridine38-40 synthase
VRTIKLLLHYEGTEYAGWQVQDNAATVQELIEHALTTILRERIHVAGASRTDSGVHALGQVAAFRTSDTIPLKRLLRSLNGILPRDVRAMDAVEAADDFDPRFAKEKTYRYALACGRCLSPFQRRYTWHIKESLDFRGMQEAAGALVGEHDFSSFVASGGGEKSHVRKISSIDFGLGGIINPCLEEICFERGDHDAGEAFSENTVHFDITANGFLYKMVRNIIGTLVEVGRGKIGPETMPEILDAKDRSRAGPTAPAHGLCLLSVRY